MQGGISITTLRVSERFKNANGIIAVQKKQPNEHGYILFVLGNSVNTSKGNITSMGRGTGGKLTI